MQDPLQNFKNSSSLLVMLYLHLLKVNKSVFPVSTKMFVPILFENLRHDVCAKDSDQGGKKPQRV